MKNIGNNPIHKHQANHIRAKNKRGNWLAVILFRISRRDFGFCLTALFMFCLGSICWQLNGGPPNLLQGIRYYFGKRQLLTFLYYFCYRANYTARPLWNLFALRCACYRLRCPLPSDEILLLNKGSFV